MSPQISKFTTGRENGAGRDRPRGYADWNPHRKTRILISLVATYGFEKTERSYARLCEHLVRARRAKMIAFEVIRDDGVFNYSSKWHDGPDEFWDETGRRIREYRRDRQVGEPHYIELWCEAKGMASQLARVANEFSVPVLSAGGFGSLTSTRRVADRALTRNVPTVLLHVGDLDPSGESIFDSLAEDAAAFVDADRVVTATRVEAHRVALTRSQVEAFGLETAPAKKSDSRALRWEGETCQLEALSPDQLAKIVHGAIEERFNLHKFDLQIAREEDDRLDLLHALPAGGGTDL